MTKRDHIQLARALRTVLLDAKRDHSSMATFGDLYAAIAGVLSRDNPRFDRDRFRAAVYEGTIIERPGCTPRAL